MNKVFLYLMNKKGLTCLQRIIEKFGPAIIEGVSIDKDPAVANDYSTELATVLCAHKISFSFRGAQGGGPSESALKIAIGWRRLIKDTRSLVIFHDSLLPKMRGFNPLVTAMLNRLPVTGVTALWASEFPDHGPIIGQKELVLTYPSSIESNIDKMSVLYADLTEEVISNFLANKPIPVQIQDETLATYSLWRDDEDYEIDWQLESTEIEHQINCLGFPYLGAKTTVNEKVVRIHSAFAIKDVAIENRTPGKVFGFDRNKNPIVVCGKGLILLDKIMDNNSELLKINSIKTRFK